MENFPLAISDTTMMDVDVSLKYLALNALDLTVPASDILLKNRLKSWFQLSGHPDGFAPAGPGTVWKRLTGDYLLFGFNDPYVMDIKLGTRTFLETEVSKKIARNDLYEKMIAVDPNEPSYNEHCCKAITKLRYMLFREQQSSTCSHGFRIEAMKLAGKEPITNLKTVKHHSHVFDTMSSFIGNRKKTCHDILIKLNDLRSRTILRI
ncbi:inositol-trisphosphate 3-kinase homolog [Aphidius gifuensis]|uniref:inositol-trisphosphate 3-kinase homolog n=1 Tax=Aphidius gifuensis TaxID=684658 RepID=UPI001CDCE297|nr:inositol-trisphosphate 3-kinase homolog [Aphidius gifuensis]